MTLLNITDIDLRHKRVLIREDFNVPIIRGQIKSENRIRAALPTIEYALEKEASIILLSHLGRPTEGSFSDAFSLHPVASALSNHLNTPVRFVKDWINGITIRPGEVILCENVRLQQGEQSNDAILAQKMAQLADIVVMDAFAVAHRATASTIGLVQHAKQVCTGLLLQSELENLTQIFTNPEDPLVAVIGGSKISTKLKLLESLIVKADSLLLGGGLANNFLVAQGNTVGDSLYELNLIEETKKLIHFAKEQKCDLYLPEDVVICHYHDNEPTIVETKQLSNINEKDRILDIGPITAQKYADHLKKANTILWNGTMGLFEESDFQEGTKVVANAINDSHAFSIVGGGETLLAVEYYSINPSYVSTGGGAFLSFLEGNTLAMIKALQDRSNL